MSAIRECAPFPFLTMLVLCLIAPLSFAGSPSYHHNVAVGQDGRPSLKLTNDADIPMVAFMMAEFPSLGMEGRTYFDYFTNERNLPIQPGASITRSLSYFPKSDVSKVRAAVRAAIFQDGSTAGDPVWVNAILARRLRLYDRIISLRNLLGQKGSSESSPEAVIAMLRAAQSEADKQLPEDDLRVIDDTMFYGAISTIENNRQASVEAVVERYLGYLELQAARLQRSRPSLDTIRGAPVTIPNPLTDESLPPDLQDARAAYASKVVPYAGGNLSSCTVLGAGFDDHQIPLAPCPGNSATDNQYPLFTNSFGFFNASTGKPTAFVINIMTAPITQMSFTNRDLRAGGERQ